MAWGSDPFAHCPDFNCAAANSFFVMWGRDKHNVVFTCGHSVLKRTSRTNVGRLMLAYSGGGHEKVGICQVALKGWEKALGEIVALMREDG